MHCSRSATALTCIGLYKVSLYLLGNRDPGRYTWLGQQYVRVPGDIVKNDVLYGLWRVLQHTTMTSTSRRMLAASRSSCVDRDGRLSGILEGYQAWVLACADLNIMGDATSHYSLPGLEIPIVQHCQGFQNTRLMFANKMTSSAMQPPKYRMQYKFVPLRNNWTLVISVRWVRPYDTLSIQLFTSR